MAWSAAAAETSPGDVLTAAAVTAPAAEADPGRGVKRRVAGAIATLTWRVPLVGALSGILL